MPRFFASLRMTAKRAFFIILLECFRLLNSRFSLENYFNYFTEIEECFRRCRGTPTLLSTLDWALIESWKEGGIPLEAVLNGVERTFKKYQKRPKRFQKINSLAYCSQEVFQAAAELNAALTEGGVRPSGTSLAEAPFSLDEIRAYLNRNADVVEKASKACAQKDATVLAQDLQECAKSVREISSRDDWLMDLEKLEQHLTAVEDKLTAALTRGTPVELLAENRREVDRGLASSRQKMTAVQIESLERQFLKKRLFEHSGVPRLSLFYL